MREPVNRDSTSLRIYPAYIEPNGAWLCIPGAIYIGQENTLEPERERERERGRKR